MADLKVVQIDDLVSISENALITIAGIALNDVEGVFIKGLKADEKQKALDKTGIKNLKKSIDFIQHDQGIMFEVSISITYGSNIEETSKKVQQAIFEAIERNIGVKPYKVNVIVNGIEF